MLGITMPVSTKLGEVVGHFRLHFLPPYSPELNPIERVWKLTCRCCLHNRYFHDLSDVVQALKPRFHYWSRPNSTLRRFRDHAVAPRTSKAVADGSGI